ncbi:hypothetical protein MCOR21_000002 [Pyricularia oryzae]|nr:hypothetical protein MCOR21_000002 [Pyricularia oryzae]
MVDWVEAELRDSRLLSSASVYDLHSTRTSVEEDYGNAVVAVWEAMMRSVEELHERPLRGSLLTVIQARAAAIDDLSF